MVSIVLLAQFSEYGDEQLRGASPEGIITPLARNHQCSDAPPREHDVLHV